MLLYHFGSREGMLAAIVGVIEARQRAALASLAASRGLLLDLLAGADHAEVTASYELFVRLVEQSADGPSKVDPHHGTSHGRAADLGEAGIGEHTLGADVELLQ